MSSTLTARFAREALFVAVVITSLVGVAPAQNQGYGPLPSYEQITDASHRGNGSFWGGAPVAPSQQDHPWRDPIDPIQTDPLLEQPKAPSFTGSTVTLAQLKNAPPAKAVREMEKAQVAFQEGDDVEGIKRLEKAIEIHPSFIEARNNLGVQYYKQGRVEDAAKQFEHALDLDPNAPLPHINLAVALQEIGEPDAAIRNAEKALELAPTLPGAHYNLGTLLSQQGRRLDEAVTHLSVAERSYPKATLILAEALLQQGRSEEAQAALKRFLSMPAAVNLR
ncbi:MAG: tetratricopeptide repeat protein [Acidobacteria bacterium]|nr:tetratricopeptide repeat protein [Acidobacteriota bacterium]